MNCCKVPKHLFPQLHFPLENLSFGEFKSSDEDIWLLCFCCQKIFSVQAGRQIRRNCKKMATVSVYTNHTQYTEKSNTFKFNLIQVQQVHLHPQVISVYSHSTDTCFYLRNPSEHSSSFHSLHICFCPACKKICKRNWDKTNKNKKIL